VSIGCTFDLEKLIMNMDDLPKTANFFYDLFLEDYNGDLIDVPILINNLKTATGNQPNEGRNPEDIDSWVLTRRFFMFDTLTGINEEGDINVIRYAKEVVLQISLDPNEDKNEMIYVPYLFIDYKERTRDEILRDDLTALTTVAFKTEYIMDEEYYRRELKTTGIICIVVLCLTWLLHTYCRYCARPSLGANVAGAEVCFKFVQSFIKAVDLFSTLFFWFLIYQTGNWFVFFKL
jgi:hypothetical protein